jgi:DNA-binding transcriptional LysR family regulator
MSLDEYEAFMHVVEQGSVSAAARQLQVPRPTLSRRLARLEERLGASLVQRGARELVVTRTGHALYERVRGALSDLAQAEAEIAEQGGLPRGVLRIAVAPLLASALAPLLISFQHDFPAVTLQVHSSTRFVDLAAEGFDLALRAGLLRDPDLIQRKLATFDVGVFGAPSYLAAHGAPREPADLVGHRLLLDVDGEGRARLGWPLRQGGFVPVRGGFVTDDRSLMRQAAVAGHGLALLTEPEAVGAVRAGSLAPVLRDAVGMPLALYLVYPDRRRLPARARALIDALTAFFRAGAPEV